MYKLHTLKHSLDGSTMHVSYPFESPFRGVRRNIHTSSIARWKARDRLPIFAIIERFSLALTSKSAFLRGWVILRLKCYAYRQHLYTVR